MSAPHFAIFGRAGQLSCRPWASASADDDQQAIEQSRREARISQGTACDRIQCITSPRSSSRFDRRAYQRGQLGAKCHQAGMIQFWQDDILPAAPTPIQPLGGQRLNIGLSRDTNCDVRRPFRSRCPQHLPISSTSISRGRHQRLLDVAGGRASSYLLKSLSPLLAASLCKLSERI